MIKKIILAICISVVVTSVHAQQMIRPKARQSCRPVYMGLSTGLENQSGLIGFNLDVPVAKSVSVGGGLGLSSWGYKLYAEGRYYFKPCHRGWAIGAGVSHNTGLNNFSTSIPAYQSQSQDVVMDFKPATNGFIAAYHFFNVGNGHRFYLETGYSIRLTSNNYIVTSGGPITPDGRAFMDIMQPGGFILALGFSFGVGG